MDITKGLYRESLTLLTDLYQLTMAYGYWKQGIGESRSIFHLFFRRHPFQGGYTVAAGLQSALDFIERFGFTDGDVQFLSQLSGNDGLPLFESEFLDYLRTLKLTIDVDAVAEGTVVFPHAPLLRVNGPLIQAQLLETPFLNMVNFQTLIATKAARICSSAGSDSVLEFGLRRAQGIDGALTASRAAFIGGCAATSNVLAGKIYGIPVKGTHAHSWVMSFDDEASAFENYAAAMPNNCVFLVDTYDTLVGVRRAIEVGHKLRRHGHEMVGVRLDSGDLAYLSIEARKLLDEGGFPDAVIVASNDLDEHLIQSLKSQGARIAVWGVGTKLATAFDQPALGGVYKLAALENELGQWVPKIKLSEQLIKTSTPGKLQVRRYMQDGIANVDMIYDELNPLPDAPTIIDPLDSSHRRPGLPDYVDLLQPVVRNGILVGQQPTLDDIRQRVIDQRKLFHRSIQRLDHPHKYPCGLEETLFQLKTRLVHEARGIS